MIVAFDPVDRAASALAASIWRSYRRDGGTRDQVVADRLLTRDRGFYRDRFGDLRIVDPST